MMQEGAVCQYILMHSFKMVGWIFLYIWYHDQVPWAANACKTEFGSVPHLGNYGNYGNKFRVFVVTSQRRM